METKRYMPPIPPSGVQLVPTKLVRFKENGVEALINGSDFDDEVHELVGAAKKPAAGAGSLDTLTVAALTELAEDRKVDLGGATKKADIVAALVAAGVSSA